MNYNQKLNILLVDDDPATLQILEKILIQEGYGVIIANNGPEARRCVIEHQPDLVLLDVMMPGENGFHVIEGLKKAPHTSNIPVIFFPEGMNSM